LSGVYTGDDRKEIIDEASKRSWKMSKAICLTGIVKKDGSNLITARSASGV
jgi:hypothetical protein